jgi:hypothetical protein
MLSEGFGKHCDLVEWGRGVDLQLFSPDRRSASFREARGIAETDILILWVGRIVPEKRPDIWMNVVQRLAQEGLPVKGLVVGHGTYEATLAEIPNVVCAGWLAGVGLAEAYASADILLFPSDVETFGNVTLEALAAGCVCVVEHLCGGHLVTSGYNGFTCPAGDQEKFYEATKRLAEDHALRREMGQHAREYSWKYERNKILQQMLEYYKDAIIRHSEPEFMKSRMKIPEAAGRNLLSTLCCNFYPIKYLAEPFLNTTSSIQNVAYSSTECYQSTKGRVNSYCLHSCGSSDMSSSGHDDETRSKLSQGKSVAALVKVANSVGSALAYVLIVVIIYASFTV